MQVGDVAAVDSLTIIDISHLAEVGSLESSHVSGVHLGDILGVEQQIVHAHHHATAHRLRTGSSDDTGIDVARAIGTDCRRRAHGANEDDGLVAVDSEVEEVSGLLHRVGTVSDDDAVVAFVVEQFIDALGEFEPHIVVHVLRPDVDELLSADICHIKHLWHGLYQRLHTYLPGTVGRVGGGSTHTGNGSAGGNDSNLRLGISCETHHKGEEQQKQRKAFCSHRKNVL